MLLFCFSGLILNTVAHAEEKKADYYQPLYSKSLTAKPLKGPLSRIIELPFQLIKWPIDKGLVLTEEYRLDRKTKWVFERMAEYGFRPHLDSLDFANAPSYGADFDFVKFVRKKAEWPDLVAKGWINHGPASYFRVGTELGAERIAETGAHASGIFQYENRRDESFYGIGPNSSLGDSTSFIQEVASVGAGAGYRFSPVLDLTARVTYDHVNIKSRAHDGKGDANIIFAGQNIPGLRGDDLLKLSIGIDRDTRNNKEGATKGSYQKLLFKFTEGVDSSPARFLTYQVDMAKYFQLGSERRILVTRFFGEFNQTVNRGEVPFYEMARLGGSGMFPRLGQTHRAFVFNRFFGQSALLANLEYRYTVWQYKDFKMNAVFFLDEGQVSKDFGTFRFKNFRESYGIGFHLSYAQIFLCNFSIAHGDEGTQFYVETGLPF